MKKILILIASVCAILPAGAEQETQKIKSPIYRLTDDGVQEPVYFDDQTRSLGSLQLNSNISGITLSVPGTYILANNFTLTSPINITGNNISFDLNGFTISGGGTPGAGSLVNVTSVNNVTIKNGTVKNGPRSGILLTSSSKVTVENVSSNNNNYAGFELVSCTDSLVKSCKALKNSTASDAFGITTMAGSNNTFDSCLIKGTSTTSSTFGDQATGIRIADTEIGSSVVNCTVCDTTATNINAQPFGIRMQPTDPTLTEVAPPMSINRDTTINDLAWSPDGKFLAVANGDAQSTANVIDIFEFSNDTYRLLYSTVSDVGVRAVSWSPDGRYLAVGNENNAGGIEVAVYEFDGVRLSASPLATFEVGARVDSVDWAPNGRYIAVGQVQVGTITVQVLRFSASGTPALTQMATFDHGATVGTMGIRNVHWSYDGRYLAIGGESGTGGFEVRILEFLYNNAAPGTNILTKVVDIENSTVSRAVRWSPNGQYLAVGRGSLSSSNNIQVYEFSGSSATVVATSVAPVGSSARKIRWSQDGRYIFSGSAITSLASRVDAMRFNPGSGTGITPLAFVIPPNFVEALDISPDGTLITAGVFEGASNEVFTYSGLGFATNCVINNTMVKNTAGASTGQAGANNGFGIVASTAQNQVTNNSCFRNDLNYAFSINVFEQFIANLKASKPLPFANLAFPTPS